MTYAVSPDGFQEAKARFTVELPSTGNWRLEFYVPELRGVEFATANKQNGRLVSVGYRTRKLGTHELEVAFGDQHANVELDGREADVGWNDLGTYEIESPTVHVTIVGVRDGMAIADAIKWTRAESEPVSQ